MTFKSLGAISLLLFWALSGLFAQQENVWAFGHHAGIDFNSGSAVAINTNLLSREGCAAVCNDNGELLFYTSGERVWDRNNNIMQNGFSINSRNVVSTTQGTLIVPFPDSSSKYYIFSLTAEENRADRGRLYYSVVDMELNSGLGAVVDGRKEILIATGLRENMTAVAGTTCNIWLLASDQQGQLRSFSIDHNGINLTPVTSPIIPGAFTGTLCVSPDKTKIALATASLSLYDFNVATGTVSNARELIPHESDLQPYAVCFSPDNSKLYATMGWEGLKQFDISSGIQSQILASVTTVPGIPPAAGTLRLGPDGKIYFAKIQGNFLGVINQPNLAGAACAYDPQGLALANTTYIYFGLPSVVCSVVPTGDTIIRSEFIEVSDCFATSYRLDADPLGKDYLWDNDALSATRIVHDEGTYWVQYLKHCNVHIDSFKVSFPNAFPDLEIHPSCRQQQSGGATLVTDTNGYVFYWMSGQGDTLSNSNVLQQVPGGAYTLRLITPAGCDTQLTVEIPEIQYSAAFFADSFVCQGSSFGLTNQSDSYFTEFEWDFGDGATATQQHPTHSYAHPGSYTSRLVASGAICRDTAFRTIIVDSLFSGRFQLSHDSICIGESVDFLPDADSTVLSRLWEFGDGSSRLEHGDDYLSHAYDSAGVLAVYLSTVHRACPASSFTDTLYVIALPEVDLGPDTGLCLKGHPMVLGNQRSGPLGATYLWSTGDTTATIQARHPGTYKLTVSTTPLGCTNSEEVIVSKDCHIDIPNAFTPNEDGANDYFFPRQLLSKKLERFHMKIVNRWGQVVFQTSNTDGRGWDGRFQGDPQPAGVYIYQINLTLHPGKEEQYMGNLTLLR